MKSGIWLGGAYADANGRRSYAAGYPEPPDLFLAAAVEVDPETGAFTHDMNGDVALLEGGLLVRWEEVEHLSSSTPENRASMVKQSKSSGRLEKRGGYASSSKPASKLKPPPKGPAPGAASKPVATSATPPTKPA